jgi:hypothetical protein
VLALIWERESPRHRYVTTTFCYGCYLGLTQTARSLKDVDRFQVVYINQYHITEQKLLDVNVHVINRYNRFLLPQLWGSGQRAAAKVMPWVLLVLPHCNNSPRRLNQSSPSLRGLRCSLYGELSKRLAACQAASRARGMVPGGAGKKVRLKFLSSRPARITLWRGKCVSC